MSRGIDLESDILEENAPARRIRMQASEDIRIIGDDHCSQEMHQFGMAKGIGQV
jgi:hypothetical protein